jgi:hypothetical protein
VLKLPSFGVEILCFFFFFWWYWGLNSRVSCLLAGALLLEPLRWRDPLLLIFDSLGLAVLIILSIHSFSAVFCSWLLYEALFNAYLLLLLGLEVPGFCLLFVQPVQPTLPVIKMANKRPFRRDFYWNLMLQHQE